MNVTLTREKPVVRRVLSTDTFVVAKYGNRKETFCCWPGYWQFSALRIRNGRKSSTTLAAWRKM